MKTHRIRYDERADDLEARITAQSTEDRRTYEIDLMLFGNTFWRDDGLTLTHVPVEDADWSLCGCQN